MTRALLRILALALAALFFAVPARASQTRNMMPAYYNEVEPFAAQWLRNLITANLIAQGEVDERSIAFVHPEDVRDFDQCHFFAGLGGWSYALRCAGWADAQKIWTGSCPCQPFSCAGAQRGTADERHLWPEWFRLIRECRPATVLGEQVASPAALAWIDVVSADLEGEGYAVGAADLCAAGVGAPHIRQRLYWVGIADSRRLQGRMDGEIARGTLFARSSDDVGSGLANTTPRGFGIDGSASRGAGHASQRESASGMGNTGESRSSRDAGTVLGAQAEGEGQRGGARGVADQSVDASAANDYWSDAEWIPCSDGKARPVKPGLECLVDGVPGRVGRLRAYGNALCAPVATAFVEAVMECVP